MNTDIDTLTAPLPPTAAGAAPADQKLLRRAARFALAAGLALLVFVAAGIWSRHAAERRLEHAAAAGLAAPVIVVHPTRGGAADDLVLPANVQAYIEAPIYARTHGYLKKWYFDIGAHVRRGQLLAEIDTPEVDAQLAQARADLKVAQANAALAGRTAERWKSLLRKNAVSQQETDQALADFDARQAAVDASQANVNRLEQLQDYEKVYAPFDGIITARQTDTGALIDAGSSPKELFHLAAIDRLRVYAAVPEVSAGEILTARQATLTSDQFPNRVFHGTIARNSSAIDPITRTLTLEVDIDNADGQLLPGSYGFIHIVPSSGNAPLTIPANTLIFRAQGLQAAVVRQGRAVLVPIAIGRDFGDRVEVVSGLTPQDQVILDPSDSLLTGSPVEVEQGG